ncbi:YqeG family HAD IIIA-type phosphatase [Streptococcus ovuberis]|uniref:YqeG family HAD IIIA-type phosphatase n=1 Tax=Streptococcus ovuberis TaxID=1936207 RepID=A0A7X6MXZ4_9STRE|nr:YqeG family HAD IIIA-type phosphatase [Streptococcus ovuberis]
MEKYRPTFALEAVYDLKVEDLEKHGIRAVLVDLDNTLIAWDNPDGTLEMKEWLHDMRDAGIKVVVVSNNTTERVRRAVQQLEIPFVSWSMKPFNIGIKKAMRRFDIKPEEVVMVGDQLMTDIRAAHRAGIRSILVRPLVQTDSKKTKINRMRERAMLKKIVAKYGPIAYQRRL